MEKRQEGIRRLQTGVLGLLSVMLLIGLTGLITSNRDQTNRSEQNDPSTGLDMPASNEPLAELGVQPALKEDSDGNTVMPVPPAATPSQGEPIVQDLELDPELERLRRDQTQGE